MSGPAPGTRGAPAPGALCAIVLAAGEGSRLRPLTGARPKALCPVGNVPLLDRALARLAHHGLSGPARVAVNACYLADQVTAHVGGRAFLSVEPGPPALGTAGAVANLRDWIAGRGVLVGNADAYLAAGPGLMAPAALTPAFTSPAGPAADLMSLLSGWDGTTVRVLAVPTGAGRQPEFGDRCFAGFSLLPAAVAADLPVRRSELVGEVWRPAEGAGRLEVVTYAGTYLDCGTPADYLAANLHAAGDGSLIATDAEVTGQVWRSVVGGGARVAGSVRRCVVFPGGSVAPDEHLVDAVRTSDGLTVQC
jgi:NDP-sugar pyrophosphorylase family protein